jgi:hypothetical protein
MKQTGPIVAATLWLAGGASVGMAQEAPAPGCSGSQAREFDFWIGRWEVTEKGRPAGVNSIERILDGCALLENWTGAGGSSGKSLNFFDAADGQWHQTWIDGSGGALFLAGKFTNGAMRMEGTRPASAKQPATRHRITWTPNADGTVRQLWESAPLDVEQWSVLFDGTYTRIDLPSSARD